MLSAVTHLLGVSYYVWLLYFVFALRPENRGDPEVLQQYMDFRTKYFSVWALVAQAVVLSLCFADDVARLSNLTDSKRRPLQRLRDLLFVGYAAPLAMTGCLMYAGLAWWDRDLVMPPALDAAMPPWLNQAMHTVSAIQVVVQLLWDPLGPSCLGAASLLGATVSGAYVATMIQEYMTTGRWLYPVLRVLGWPGRVGISVFTTVLYLAQVAIFRAVIMTRWGPGADGLDSKRDH